MKNGMRFFLMAVGALALGTAQAHLEPGSLSVKAGDKLQVGATVQVKWTVESTHAPGSFDINLSTNGGTSFEKIETKTFPLTPGEFTYSLTVPNKPSTTAQIQLCQYDGTVKCTGVYTLKSPNFTIEAGSSISDEGRSSVSPGLRFNAGTRNLEADFELVKDEKVVIQAFNAQGKLVATLLDGTQEVGVHKLSIFSNGLDNSSPLVFQMRIGDQVHSQSWNAGR